MEKYRVPYLLNVPTHGVTLTGGRFLRAFENNISFLKGFDPDRILYYWRVHQNRPAPKTPYAHDAGHFERNLKGQTAGEFLMGAGATLLWREDAQLREISRQLLDEMEGSRQPDGMLIPITRDEYKTREYPNYVRAWITFGLLDIGYAGEKKGFELARSLGDFFNGCEVLPYVKDMNLGFQGILANTRLYDSPVGKEEDILTAQKYYQEDWYLEQLIQKDHRAIYDHPGNHPHSTLLTTLEGYLDLYRTTGARIYIDAVKSALSMYEEKWQHVGGGINMCEFDTYYPGCNWLSPKHNYNELCSTNFWVLLNQRMRRLEPDNAHYADEIEESLYNMLLASQVGDQGFHYLNFLERDKDARYLDRCTCCASLGTRLAGLLPQFLYAYGGNTVYADLYADSEARLPLRSGEVSLRCCTEMPDGGAVRIEVAEASAEFELKLRIPRWSAGNAAICKNGQNAAEGRPGSYVALRVKNGDVIEFTLPMGFSMKKYSGGEEIPGKERWAMSFGPLLYAALGPSIVEVSFDPEHPEQHFSPIPGCKRRFRLIDDDRHEYMAYLDIHDEPFSVYPIVNRPNK